MISVFNVGVQSGFWEAEMAKKPKVEVSFSFEEIWDVMEEAVESISFDEVPRDWRTMPELNDDPDDEEIAVPSPQVAVTGKKVIP